MHVPYHYEVGNVLNGTLPAQAPVPATGGCSCNGQSSNGNGNITGVLGNSNVVILLAIAFAIGMAVKK